MATILYDQTAESYRVAGGTTYDPTTHIILAPLGWIQKARRICRRPSLFLCFHREAGSIVLCDWQIRPGKGRGPGLFTELDVLAEKGYKTIKYPSDAAILSRVAPMRAQMKSIRKRLAMAREAKRQLRLVTAEERAGVIKMLERRHGPMHPHVKDAFHYISKEEGGEQLRQMTDSLKTVAKILRR